VCNGNGDGTENILKNNSKESTTRMGPNFGDPKKYPSLNALRSNKFLKKINRTQIKNHH
jgi:hypothetical protein